MSNISNKSTKELKDFKNSKSNKTWGAVDRINTTDLVKNKDGQKLENESFLYKLAEDFRSRDWEHFICDDILVFVTGDNAQKFTFYFRWDEKQSSLTINCQIVQFNDIYHDGEYLDFVTDTDLSLINVLNNDEVDGTVSDIEKSITLSSDYRENNALVKSYKRQLRVDKRHWRYQIAHAINSLLNANDLRHSIN